MTRARSTGLMLALLVSVGVHAVVITSGWLKLPLHKDDPAPLQARLDPAPLPAPSAAPKPLAAPARPKPRVITPRIAAAPPAVKSDVPEFPVAPTPDPASVAQAAEADVLAQAPEATPVAEPVVLADAAPSTFVPEPAIIRTLPRRGRIAYAMNYYMNSSPTLIGHTVQSWEAVDNTYRLDSHSETVGFARLTRFGPRVFQSHGTVNERGLLPGRFTSKVVVSGISNDSAAQFDWAGNALQFGRANDPKSAPLHAGSQDLLSFMYQLSLAPPPRGRLQMPITNGTRFETYDIDVFDEETIETPLGPLRALPVKQVPRKGRESIQVWLAAEYRYLPVRIVIIGRDGTPGGEQIATEISISEK